MNEVNERIFICRKLIGLNQTEVAEKLGIKCSTYSQMERSGNISSERLFKLAEIFGVKPCYLFYGAELCKQDTPIIPTPPTGENPDTLKQPDAVKPEVEVFVLSNKEESIIKMLRNFSKANRNDAIQYIHSLYQKEKF